MQHERLAPYWRLRRLAPTMSQTTRHISNAQASVPTYELHSLGWKAEPRLASVKAVEPTRLLRLDEAHFRQVLDAQPEVSAAIIRVITRYLRSQLKYAQTVSAQLRALESFGFLSPSIGA